MSPQDHNHYFQPTINATDTPPEFSKSDPTSRTGIYSDIPEIQYAYHSAASRETSKAWVEDAPPHRRLFDDDIRSRLDKGLWNVPTIPKPVGMTEEEKKVLNAVCHLKKRRLKLGQIDEARVKEYKRQRELSQQSQRPRDLNGENHRSEWSRRHDIPNFVVGEDLWKDIRDG